MAPTKVLDEIKEQIESVISRDTPRGTLLWNQLLELHPADIAQLLLDIDRGHAQPLFLSLSPRLQTAVFEHLTDNMKVFCLSFCADTKRVQLLESLPIDELTDLFDVFSDDELRQYLKLLHKQYRNKVLSLLKFNPDSAGGIMDSEVFTLVQDWTVEQSVRLLQRLEPNKDLHQEIYVTNADRQLVGHIRLEDLVIKHPKTRLSSFLRKNELVVETQEDKEDIAKKMLHYHLMTVPVVGENNIFLGVIPSDTLVDIIEEEATEDVYKMATMTPIKHTYFETSFKRLLFERSWILIALLLAQSISSMIIEGYQSSLRDFFMIFLTMLISTGGNASNQTSALVIQGLASGEMNDKSWWRFVRRELLMAVMMAGILGIASFVRVYSFHGHDRFYEAGIISLALALIVMVSVLLGSCMPFVLQKLRLDPAFSAGPFLATMMDIIGVFIYCYIVKFLLF